ncbi:hypothetical protein QSH57_009880 [Fusarium oxysporum f. sp. vasinfectum]|nr:hypothetical protein QSH57_009880 [Fusarium oxysporum f. sp. vasinfectum]
MPICAVLMMLLRADRENLCRVFTPLFENEYWLATDFPSYGRPLYEVFKFDFWLGAVSQFVVSTPQVMTPFTLRFLIEWVQHVYPDGHDTRGSTPVAAGIGYVLGIAVLQMLQTFASSQFYYRGMLLGGQTRSVLAGGQTGSEGSGPYDGIPCRVDEKGWSNGRVMSLVSNDTARSDIRDETAGGKPKSYQHSH